MVKVLDDEALLPAIVFIFSRVGCDAAVRQLLGPGVRLTSPGSSTRSPAILAPPRAPACPTPTCAALDYDWFAEAMARGIAAHHAGMLPAFKECVEEAFVRGLIKVVFATETLALGHQHAGPLRGAGEAGQVQRRDPCRRDAGGVHPAHRPGRAPRHRRRGPRRRAVAAGLDPRAVAGLASRRTYPLRSSFAPTYNMAVNLVGSVGRDRARTLLEQSFAQFQSDRSVVGAARERWPGTPRRSTATGRPPPATAATSSATRGCGPEIAELEAEAARERQSDRRAEAMQTLLILKPGDIVRVPSGRSQGWAVIIDPGSRKIMRRRDRWC